jgi:lipopolysaccharide export system protein LptA
MLAGDAPLYVAGKHLEYDGDSRRAVYTGDARLWQGATAVSGERVALDEATGNLSAQGAVRSALQFREPGAGPGATASLATAEEFVYDDSLRRATYTGKPMGSTTSSATGTGIGTAAGARAGTATGARANSAGSGPVTSGAAPGTGTGASTAGSGPGAGSRAGAATPASPGAGTPAPKPAKETLAHVSGPQGDLVAQKVEMYLAANDSTLERVEAYGQVTLRTQGVAATASPGTSTDGRAPSPSASSTAGRSTPSRSTTSAAPAATGEPAPPKPRVATGARMTYLTATERYVMSGTPVAIVEECRETTGKSLTFFRSTDTISVDGNEEIRTQTKTGKDCPELP